MNEDQLKKLLARQADTPVDPEAKREAIDAAMAAFRAEHASAETTTSTEQQKNSTASEKNSQGFFHWLRLTFSSNKKNRRQDMSTPSYSQQKWVLGGIATACVAVFGLMVATYNPVLKAPEETFSSAPAPLRQSTEAEREIRTQITLDDAQTPPAPLPKSAPEPAREEIRVEGIRETLAKADALERSVAEAEADAYSTGQVARLKEAKKAESLQRLSSVPAKPQAQQNYQDGAMPATALGIAMRADSDQRVPPGYHEEGRDRFENFEINPVKRTADEPVSTFSIDVDTASYSFVRRELNRGVLPQKDAVRLEEMVNYFDYNYPLPADKSAPFSRSVTMLDSPWNPGKKLIHIGIRGYDISEQPKSNLVFLLDVSGSMNSPDKLPLVKQSMELLLSKLRPDDTVSIAVYAGAAGTVLEPTEVKDKQKILSAINGLRSGGSTAGAQGIKLAYQLAESSFKKDAVNRIILATDGDFNVGITSTDELKGFVERKREKGIYLSVLGFGAGNYHDKLMQDLAQNGNGVAAYIDTLSEAQKVLVNEATSNLFPIAKDVKIQVEFNPATVSEYRLLGYETRKLNREDFNNDAVDAGEIGSGHTVTAIYEITPAGSAATLIDESRYSKRAEIKDQKNNEYAFLKIRYKLPEEDKSRLLTTTIQTHLNESTDPTLANEARFATAVAGFAQLLKDPRYLSDWNYDDAIALAQAHKGADEFGYRTEFVQLIRRAKTAAGM